MRKELPGRAAHGVANANDARSKRPCVSSGTERRDEKTSSPVARMAQYRRKIRLIQPRLQLKLIASFLGMSALALALQFLLLAAALSRIAVDLPQDGPFLMEELPSTLTWIVVLSFMICLPLTFCVGVLMTFRIAGPIYRFEQFLRATVKGDKPADCRLRNGDELQDLCTLINQATSSVRAPAETPAPRQLDRAA